MARELSLFIDESGDKSTHARYFILTLLLHDQSMSIAEDVHSYERRLLLEKLPNIPFHSEPLLNGHKEYEYLSIESRKKILSIFSSFVRQLPFRYKSFVYRRLSFTNAQQLSSRIETDISSLFSEHLQYLHSFSKVKVYYDNGQGMVQRALDRAIRNVVSRQAIVQRRATMADYRLSQVADYLCTIELAAIKYEAGEAGGTYDKFFGGRGPFKRNWLKQARRKSL